MTNATTTHTANPLLDPGTPLPFDKIRAEHVEVAVDTLIAEAQTKIEGIASQSGTPTYASSLGALESSTESLELAMSMISHLENVATTPDLRAATNAVQPKVSAFSSSIPTNSGLWNVLRAFSKTDEAKALDPTRARFLEKTIQEFRRHGAELSSEDKAKLTALDVELAQTTTKFGQNTLDATNAWELVITDETKLAGLPESARAAARQDAAAKNVEGWRFTLQAPSVVPVLTYLDDESIRRDVWRAFFTRGTGKDHDNRPLIASILELRRARASLLGYADFSDLVLEERMAKNGNAAREFVDDLTLRFRDAFEREGDELKAFRLATDGTDELAPWDVGYWAEKQRAALYEFDEEQLRPYFSADAVLSGVFELVARLYGVKIHETELPTWDESVRSFRIEDSNGSLMASFYIDLFPRENKRGGGWMDPLISTVPNADGTQAPHLGFFCTNVPPPVGDTPALLTHRDVETVFHEFGHLMHHCASRASVRSLAGTNVAWDFVELPSQIMENWCWEREALDLFARHWETGELIPDELFDRMLRARNYRSASHMMRQLGHGTVDLMLHREYDPARDGDVMEYAREATRAFTPAELPDDFAMLASFGHLFSSPVAYAAGYYSYLWAEVLDADAFSRFKDAGIFDREVGRAFLELLSKGDSEDPLDLFVAFRGRAPKLDALLERTGAHA